MGRSMGPTGSQTVSAVVRAYGEQFPRVRAAVNGGPKDSGFVAVTVGTTLTYCYDLAAVESFATAWAEAVTRPTQWLSETTDDLPQSVGCQLTMQVSVAGSMPTDVRLVAAQASAEGVAHLAVRVGRIVTVVFDKSALAGYRQAWAEALDYGRRIFTNPEPDAFDEIENRIRERERRQFERTGQVPRRQ
jgi:ABC-type amino acid transport substrate-binding protein